MKALTPMRAIRAKCLDCSGGNSTEARLCACLTCPLWPYRLGHRPTVDSDEARVHVAMGKLTLDELSDSRHTERLFEVEDPT
jgi:hypothetical protein